MLSELFTANNDHRIATYSIIQSSTLSIKLINKREKIKETKRNIKKAKNFEFEFEKKKKKGGKIRKGKEKE